MRKFILVATAILGALAITPVASQAQTQQHQWCSKFKGMTNCRYSTEEQCRASRSGRGGTCFARQASR
ncbi:DUF3551 domain-containing protein [Bradyrhizobium sp. 1]|uniref:DUF3551 domain-containing protein n=1 Tax=Bradyrhizobium sp. 1 TaxID=241591 RepID=UPI001FF8DCD8|nr:DUF3551 domain-containing protein [Bradyrhizobium sp. 1]MCK1392463.1 DUF3551 domain-containing protein [Bradyrhizobium sp. 1]